MGILKAVLLIVGMFLHPYYVSFTEVVLEGDEMQIACEYFLDDFEGALRGAYPLGKFDWVKGRVENDSLIFLYMKKCFGVRVDDREVGYRFLGYEIEGGNIYCYLSVVGDVPKKKISFKNSVLYKEKPYQAHLFNIKMGKKEWRGRIQNPEELYHVQIDG